MNENEEDYVSFRVERLLKRKGFREDVSAIFECNACKAYFRTVRWPDNYNDEEGNPTYVSAPTLWQVTKWLREKQGFHIQIIPVIGHKWSFDLADIRLKQDMSGEYISRIPERECYPVFTTYDLPLTQALRRH